jgi:hypothetical protein
MNKGDKCLRVCHLLRVEGGCGLFVGHQVGACVLQSGAANMWNSVCLNSRGAFVRILLMCVGELL